MKIKKYIRRLNNTDLGLSGKNGSEIILDVEGKKLFSHVPKNKEIEFINIHDFELFVLKKKHETIQKFTSKNLQKFFTKNVLQEGDFVELIIFGSSLKRYFLNFLHDKKLFFTKTSNSDFESTTNSKLKKLLDGSDEKELQLDKDLKLNISKGQFRKKRADAKSSTQFYNIVIKDSLSNIIDIDKNFISIDLKNNHYETFNSEETVVELEIEDQKVIVELFSEYIENDWDIETKKTEKRIEYLDKILPEKLDNENPISIFEIFDINELKKIVETLKKGNANYDWDRSKGGGGEVQQTLNQYIKFLKKIKVDHATSNNKDDDYVVEELDKNNFKSFIKKIDFNENVQIDTKWKNIEFIIGQPNTGKSYNFEGARLFNTNDKENYRYKKIPVSGGIGNEYKGLQNTDLALTFDPTKQEIRFGEFLQILMSAIVNPKVPHVVFLDDFHNQDISSLLSEYTPLFKSQQMRDIDEVDPNHIIFTKTSYADSNEFIKIWNDFIDENCKDIPQLPLTNRISGESLKLVFPSNFYLFGAANFNENTLNIFADWEDRAKITYIDPIKTFLKDEITKKMKEKEFLDCCLLLNNSLKDVLKADYNVFDYDRYCFGLWKTVDSKGNVIDDTEKQKETIKFFFGMIKNALKFNNKNSYINEIGWKLFVKMQNDVWFKTNIELIKDTYKTDLELLHKYNIYEDEI